MFHQPITAAKATAARSHPQHEVYRRSGGRGFTMHTGTWSDCMDWMAARRADGVNYYLRVVA